jgi:hypothetical protein
VLGVPVAGVEGPGHDEERRADPALAEQVEQPRRVLRVRAVVEGERDHTATVFVKYGDFADVPG